MTPEAQRIAIAEACGWYPPKHPKVVELIKEWPHSKDREIWWLRPDGKEFAWISDVPDYLNDLNAVHEAEKVRFSDNEDALRLNEWAYNLYLVTRANAEDKDVALVRATAAQRAEAFLRTLGLWKDS